MELTIERRCGCAQYTVGTLLLNGVYFCDTLEPPVREYGIKIPGKTAVPAGRYKLVLNDSPRFKRVLPLLIDVPGFEGVRIHPGNTAQDTQGCFLVGYNRQKGRVVQSRTVFNKLFAALTRAEKAGETLTAEIKNIKLIHTEEQK